MPILTLAALGGLWFCSTSGIFQPFSSRHAWKKTETQHLATAQLSLFTLNHSPSSLVSSEASLGATAPRTGQRRREGPVPRKAPAAPAPPRDSVTVTKASSQSLLSSSGRVFLISARSLPGLAEAAAATSGEVPWSRIPPRGRLRAGAWKAAHSHRNLCGGKLIARPALGAPVPAGRRCQLLRRPPHLSLAPYSVL